MSAAVDHRAGPEDYPYDGDSYGDGYDYDDYDEGTQLVHQPADAPRGDLRTDFGNHLEANYQRLVAQLYAITLDPGEAHDVVQDAYSRAWRSWAALSRTPDPSAWIRRVAVRATARSWRRALAKFGFGGRHRIRGADERTSTLLRALRRLSPAERRAVVLYHMAGVALDEIAAIEQTSTTIVQARLTRGRYVVTEDMADVLADLYGGYGDDGYDEEGVR